MVAYGAQPRLACDNPTYDFGVEEDARTVSHIFELRNAGDAPLGIKEVKTCCGGSASLATNEVAPGESVALTLLLTLWGRSGAQEKAFYVVSNDPEQPFYRLCLKGHVAAKVALSRQSVFLRAASAEGEASEVLTATLAPGVPHPTGVTSEASWLEARMEHAGARTRVTFSVHPQKEGTTKNPENMVGTGERRGESGMEPPRPSGAPPQEGDGRLPKGVSRTVAQLHFPEGAPYPRIDIPVTLYVPQEISVLSPYITLPSNPLLAIQRNATLRSPSRPFKILEVRCPVPSWTSEARSTDGRMWRLTFGNLQSGNLPEHSEIVLLTDHPECPEIKIPIHVEE